MFPACSQKLLRIAICLALAGIIWAVFGQTLTHEFVNFDDDEYVYENPQVAGGLTLRGIGWAFTHVHSSNWHPVTWLSHMLDCQLYGLQPGGPHLTNVLIHMATAILLFLVLHQMTSNLWCSAFVAAVFAIHPLRAESVAWIAERKDVLSGLFFVLTLMAYVRGVKNPKSEGRNPNEIRNPSSETPERPCPDSDFGIRSSFGSRISVFGFPNWAALAFFTLGLLSKPMLVTLPFVLLLLDYWPLRRFVQCGGGLTPGRLIAEKVPLLILCGASCAITLLAQKDALAPMPLSMRLSNVPVSYAAYLEQLFYPSGLTAYYPHPEGGLSLLTIVGAIFLLLVISISVVAARRKRPWLMIGWLWYLGTLIPVIGILQVGSQAHADRYTYLPQIGLLVALAWMAADLCSGWRYQRLALGSVSAVVLTVLVFSAREQTSHWFNSESLWTHALACTSKNVVAHNNLGSALLQKGNVDEAIAQHQRALKIKPDYSDAHINLANALLQKGKVNEAIVHYREALRIAPEEAGAHFNLGNALLRKRRVEEAISHYRKALEIKPDYAEAHNHLGNALLQKESIDEAILHYQQALEIKPAFTKARNNLGYALLQKGNVDQAIVQLEKALKIKSDNPEAHYNLGNAFAQKQNMDNAIAHYQAALQIEPARADIHHKLAFALLQNGRADRAITEFHAVLQIAPDCSEAQNDLAWILATASEASLRNGSQAVVLARRANQLTGGGNPNILGTLAAAYAEAGQFSDARRSAQQAIAIAQATGRNDLVEELSGKLKLYEADVPFHQECK